MKVLDIIKRIFFGILTIAFFTFAIIMTFLLLNYNKYGVTEIGDTSLILIKEEISSENYKKGDLVIVEKKKLKNLKAGDEVFVYKLDNKNNANIELGFVGQIFEDMDAISFENGENYTSDFIIGIGKNVYNGWGTFLSIVESKWGFLFSVLVPSFLYFVYQVYSLIIEIKYGEEE